uniref:Uncharacterized protein n=1 Tax=Coccidioides posadasii RMSCC 3488 TaxID=454284 RepID=A0A0J6F9R8_COCPO|nr:hypothetical protein CPAG_06085 [Coccidioides posadasii RMSCC 3488]
MAPWSGMAGIGSGAAAAAEPPLSWFQYVQHASYHNHYCQYGGGLIPSSPGNTSLSPTRTSAAPSCPKGMHLPQWTIISGPSSPHLVQTEFAGSPQGSLHGQSTKHSHQSQACSWLRLLQTAKKGTAIIGQAIGTGSGNKGHAGAFIHTTKATCIGLSTQVEGKQQLSVADVGVSFNQCTASQPFLRNVARVGQATHPEERWGLERRRLEKEQSLKGTLDHTEARLCGRVSPKIECWMAIAISVVAEVDLSAWMAKLV